MRHDPSRALPALIRSGGADTASAPTRGVVIRALNPRGELMLWLLLPTVGAVGLIWAWHTRPGRRPRILGSVAAGCLGFQAFHMVEHLVQAAVWVAARDRPPFLTPPAGFGADTLEIAGRAGSGAELLHLAGNAVFLVGLLALAGLPGSRRPSLTVALTVQGAHLLEHVALTLSVIVAGHAVGVTTLFGTLHAGPTLWSLRVLAHLGLNATATVFAAVAVIRIGPTWGLGPTLPGRRSPGHHHAPSETDGSLGGAAARLDACPEPLRE